MDPLPPFYTPCLPAHRRCGRVDFASRNGRSLVLHVHRGIVILVLPLLVFAQHHAFRLALLAGYEQLLAVISQAVRSLLPRL